VQTAEEGTQSSSEQRMRKQSQLAAHVWIDGEEREGWEEEELWILSKGRRDCSVSFQWLPCTAR
jgi:hypothetical protein